MLRAAKRVQQTKWSAGWLRSARRRLLTWYRRNARDLPWRRTGDPYAIWVSEIMANRWTFYIGKDGKIAAIDKKINTSKAGEDVVAKLKELGVPEKK